MRYIVINMPNGKWAIFDNKEAVYIGGLGILYFSTNEEANQYLKNVLRQG